MIKLNDLIEANNLLMTMGGDDQLPRIASAAIERSLELQNRIDRALAYAAQTPPNSAHARQIARILDGSITVDDELNEVREQDRPMPTLPSQQNEPRALPVKTRGPKNSAKGLQGRSTRQRREFREWVALQGVDLPRYGPIPQELIEHYDRTVENERKSRVSQQRRQQPALALRETFEEDAG